jgi:hypothetical protein
MRFYIGTGLGNAAQAKDVRDRLVAEGYTQTYDWMAHGIVKGQGIIRLSEVAQGECEGVQTADFTIFLLPSTVPGGYRGTHCEIGMSLALGLPTIIWSDDPRPFSDHLLTCAFYHHPCVLPIVGLSRNAASTISRRVAELQIEGKIYSQRRNGV